MSPAVAAGVANSHFQDAVDPSVAAPDSFGPVQPSTLPLSSELDRITRLKEMVAPHVESFNFAMGSGIDALPHMIPPVVLQTNPEASSGDSPVRISVRYSKLSVVKPRHQQTSSHNSLLTDILPTECRRAGVSYLSDLLGEYEICVDGEAVDLPSRRIARIPMMVCSDKCNLSGKSPQQLIDMGEEQYELGGFFVINGAEKLLRMIVVPRSNAVISVRRSSNMKRGPLYTDTSVSIRCMRRDLSTATMHMHYLRTGAANVRISVGKRNEYFIPVGVLIRALLPSGVNARAIFDLLLGGKKDDEALRASCLAIVTDLDDWSKKFRPCAEETEPVHVSVSQKAALAFIGASFRVVLSLDDAVPDIEAGAILLRRYVLVHLSPGPYEPDDHQLDGAKVDMLVHMVRNLVAVASEAIEVDDGDAPSHQELLLPGQLYLNYLKERLETQLLSVGLGIRRELANTRKHGKGSTTTVPEAVQKALLRVMKADLVTNQMGYFLATGNIRSETGLDLPQTVGYAIMAERINYLRFITHFRCIHRGAFYATMRTTKVRKLLPEAWGFICPVQTPDGAPCGLLNHLASDVKVTIGKGANLRDCRELILELGADPAPSMSPLHPCSDDGSLPIVCDGCVVGFVPETDADRFAALLRQLKTRASVTTVPTMTEVVYIASVSQRSCGFYPGIYIHTTGCRMMRPVTWLRRVLNRRNRKADGGKLEKQPGDEEDDSASHGTREMIGSFEQVFLQVRPALANAEDSVTPVNVEGATHAEISSHSFMSEVASLTPFPDMNQGPRNIFQCQMAKQAMGTPCHRYETRFDSKVYRLTSPQVPITRNRCMQDPMGADLFPNGTNGIVAVISYTGYDMEDALILNQGSVNRGYAHGTIYANKRVNLDDSAVDRARQFGPLSAAASNRTSAVDTDGLPVVGARVRHEEPLYVTAPLGATEVENAKNPRSVRWTPHNSVETATVDQVQVVNGAAYSKEGTRTVNGYVRQVTIRTRFSRAPAVGDKFATRAGQKGTIASVWPTEDMPFSESGMMPDVLFNPNGFPSRMTIGMMVENMAGKSGALHGMFHDSTPFRFDEKCRAIDYFGEQLVKAGYNYYGNETLYSGYTGEPFKVDIFMGVIHYQRLRHMVSDKFQVRSTGKIHPIYRQPIQGRKRGGAIRFGEMERDGLLAHGASFLLRDRLGMASDMHVLHVCERCGSLVSPTMDPDIRKETSAAVRCCVCTDGGGDAKGLEATVHRVALPYSFKYLVHELAAMNIRTRLDLRSTEDVGLHGPLRG